MNLLHWQDVDFVSTSTAAFQLIHVIGLASEANLNGTYSTKKDILVVKEDK